MDVKQLAYFESAARLGSLSRAAEECYVSQPGISAAIRKLEAELGSELLLRTTEGVRLTNSGRLLLERAHEILTMVKDTRAEIRSTGARRRETVHVGLPPMLGSRFIEPVLALAGVGSDGLDLDVTVKELGSHEIRRELQKRTLDLGVVFDDTNADFSLGLTAESLGHTPLLIGMAPNHPFAEALAISTQQLAAERLVVMPPGALVRDILMREIMMTGVTPKIIHTSTQINIVMNLVRSGFGISIFPATIADQLKDIVLLPTDPPLRRGYSLVYRKGLVRTQGFMSAAIRITESAESLPSEPEQFDT